MRKPVKQVCAWADLAWPASFPAILGLYRDVDLGLYEPFVEGRRSPKPRRYQRFFSILYINLTGIRYQSKLSARRTKGRLSSICSGQPAVCLARQGAARAGAWRPTQSMSSALPAAGLQSMRKDNRDASQCRSGTAGGGFATIRRDSCPTDIIPASKCPGLRSVRGRQGHFNWQM